MQSDRVKAIYKVTDTHIYGFFDKHRFLSNFHAHPVLYDGNLYPSNENAYQALKTNNLSERKHIATLTPSDSKSYGRRLALREDWHDDLPKEDQDGDLIVQVRDKIMYEINCMKFIDPTLRAQLLETGDLILEETNWWKDDYWGVCNGEGLSKLGRILMKIREYHKNQLHGNNTTTD